MSCPWSSKGTLAAEVPRMSEDWNGWAWDQASNSEYVGLWIPPSHFTPSGLAWLPPRPPPRRTLRIEPPPSQRPSQALKIEPTTGLSSRPTKKITVGVTKSKPDHAENCSRTDVDKNRSTGGKAEGTVEADTAEPTRHASGQPPPPPKMLAASASATGDLDPVYGLHPIIVAQLSGAVKAQILIAKQRFEDQLGLVSSQQASAGNKMAVHQVDARDGQAIAHDGQAIARPEKSSAAKDKTAEMHQTADQAAKSGECTVLGSDTASQKAEHLAVSFPPPESDPQNIQQTKVEPKLTDGPDEVLDSLLTSLTCQHPADLGAMEGPITAAPRPIAEDPDDFLGSLLGASAPAKPPVKQSENEETPAAATACKALPPPDFEKPAKPSEPAAEDLPKPAATTESQPAAGAPKIRTDASAEARQKVRIALAPPVGDPGPSNFSARKEAAAKFQGAPVSAAWEVAVKTAAAVEKAQKAASAQKPVIQQPESVSSPASDCSQPASVSTKPPFQTDDVMSLLGMTVDVQPKRQPVRGLPAAQQLLAGTAQVRENMTVDTRDLATANKPETGAYKPEAGAPANTAASFLDELFAAPPKQGRQSGSVQQEKRGAPQDAASLAWNSAPCQVVPDNSWTEHFQQCSTVPWTREQSSDLKAPSSSIPSRASSPVTPKVKKNITSLWDDIFFSGWQTETSKTTPLLSHGPAALKSAAKRGLHVDVSRLQAPGPAAQAAEAASEGGPQVHDLNPQNQVPGLDECMGADTPQGRCAFAEGAAVSWTDLERSSMYHKFKHMLYCPLSRQIMTEPSIAENGITYERSAILDYLRCYGVDPQNPDQPMGSHLRPNLMAERLIELVMDSIE